MTVQAQDRYKRCVILLADGARYDVLSELLAAGRLPNINEHILKEGSLRKAVTAFPSTTGPAHIPFLTGALPATCNVPGIRWFDKDLYARYGHGSVASFGAHGRYRSYVGLETFRINSDMRNDIYNVFELLPRSYCIFNSINRGVGKRNLTRIMRIWYWYYGHLTDRWRYIDAVGIRKTLSAVERDLDFIFTVLPGIDEFSHLAHPRHRYALEQYSFLDDSVGKLARKLKELGKWDDTLIWIVSDHGLSATHTHFCVNTFLEDRGIKTFYFPLIYRKGCDAASMVSGNGMTHVYFRDRAKDGIAGWEGRMTIESLSALYPGLIDDLLKEPAVDVIAMTDNAGNIVAKTRRGESRFKMDGGQISYKVVGHDAFQYKNVAAEALSGDTPKGAWWSEKGSVNDFLNKTIDSDYPDAPYQLAHLFTSPRSGDMVISATPGYDLRIKYEHPEHKGSHGSIHRQHMLVPVLCNARLPDSPMRTVDVFPTYLKLMGHPVPTNIDGRALI